MLLFLILIIIAIVGVLIFLYYYRKEPYYANIIQKLVRQAARWSVAAEQDENPMIAVLHANYGAAYLWALKDIAADSEIEKVTGINLEKFENKIVTIQDFATRRMAQLCPSYAPEPSILTSIAGEG